MADLRVLIEIPQPAADDTGATIMETHKADAADHVMAYLDGIRYPADKDDVIRAALANHAPKHVLDLLEHLTRFSFVVPADLIEAYEQIRRPKG